MNLATRILRKVKSVGLLKTVKTVLQIINYRLFQADWDFKIVPSVLENLLKEHGGIVIVQIGANVGKTESDQIYSFLARNFGPEAKVGELTCCAILVEPIRHLYEQLVDNYKNFKGVHCRNIAIAEFRQFKKLYRLREGIDLAGNGLPPWAEELGSFAREQLDALWKGSPGNRNLREFVEANIVEDDVSCLPLDELFTECDLVSVDFLQIDTEGYDFHVLKTIDFEKIKPRFINFERIHLKHLEPGCRKMLIGLGYKLHDHGQDTLCELTKGVPLGIRMREWAYQKWLELVY